MKLNLAKRVKKKHKSWYGTKSVW